MSIIFINNFRGGKYIYHNKRYIYLKKHYADTTVFAKNSKKESRGKEKLWPIHQTDSSRISMY